MKTPLLTLIGLTLIVAACSDNSSDEAPAANAPAPESETIEDTEIKGLARSEAAEGARVFFISPSHGETVSNPVRIEFGIEGMAVVKAGDNQPHSGHHHLIVDSDLPDPTLPIPADANHIHFGDGSTTTEITLEPGEHHLQMLLGDHLHIPHNPPLVSQPIVITVE